MPAARQRLAAALLLAGACAGAHAGLPGLCEQPASVSPAEQDRALRLAGLIRQELARSGDEVALIARSGTELGRFGIRYSHAGIALAHNPAGPWSVRQLYYACDEAGPRLFDQGLAGFLLGSAEPGRGYVWLLLLPAAEARALQASALDKPTALRLLAADYSANAYAWSTRFQNCNQWVAELLAAAWQQPGLPAPTREQAQRWLHEQAYAPAAIALDSHALVFAAHFVPLIHVQDHPLADLQALTMQVSMPSSIEAFVRERAPQVRRLEICHDGTRVLVRRGWREIAAGCRPEPGDELITLE
ncbi:DUF2145 domain-containing protein [Rubrivivax gelatinosus]|uniref:DUF2145 domain-containing protein n=1 Tax=Rubrivivax gelatinosus TaxID=28068 RepID=A0ABS1DQ54_RUBGE|nr:DUF2145 domain-containing protein [Rubrivivax gelatinosus]MBK1712086.1 hypothetical protein [Rubrivivax gelatinosus]